MVADIWANWLLLKKSQRMLNALEVGIILPIHRHRNSSETQILLRGKIDVIFYDDNGTEVERFHLDPRNVCML